MAEQTISSNLPLTYKQKLTSEAIELGESLFEITLEAVESHHSVEKQEGEAYLTEEIRATAQEFFAALRLLLSVEE